MKDLAICAPAFISLLAQAGDQATWERLGIGGLGIAVTVFIWRHFVGREEAAQRARDKRDEQEKAEQKERDAINTAERNRLLQINNEQQKQMMAMFQTQIEQAQAASKTLILTQKESARQHEDALRSVKELARKIPSREVKETKSTDNAANAVVEE
jgi:uncharacterized membrane protein YhiD involved in acid resistance